MTSKSKSTSKTTGKATGPSDGQNGNGQAAAAAPANPSRQAGGDGETEAQAAVIESAEPTPVVFIMGAGVVGTALAARLVRAGVPVAGLHGRQAELSDAASAISGVLATTGEIPEILSQADVVIVSVRDERIREVVERLLREKRLRKNQVLLHTSGAIASSEVLAAARGQVGALGTLHPLVSFADPRLAAEGLRTVAFGIEGDPEARKLARKLVGLLGARAVSLEAKDMALYHAGAVLVSNYVVALADLGRGLLVEAGVPAAEALPALIPLMTSVVQNLAQVGLPGALTGPVERGDVSSVERHLRTLEERAPHMVELYRLVGREVVRIALNKGPLDADAVARFEQLFAGKSRLATS
jgi:predicted short-subunit dehydrogenase-like oxidoreductase (DUF2520 family)